MKQLFLSPRAASLNLGEGWRREGMEEGGGCRGNRNWKEREDMKEQEGRREN